MHVGKQFMPSPFGCPAFLEYMRQCQLKEKSRQGRAERDVRGFSTRLTQLSEGDQDVRILAYRALRSCDLLADTRDTGAADNVINDALDTLEDAQNDEERLAQLKAYASARFALTELPAAVGNFDAIWNALLEWMRSRTAQECLRWYYRNRTFVRDPLFMTVRLSS